MANYRSQQRDDDLLLELHHFDWNYFHVRENVELTMAKELHSMGIAGIVLHTIRYLSVLPSILS